MQSKSVMLFNFIKEADEILSKLYSTTADGRPINPGDQTWMDTRDRLMKIKVGSSGNFSYPINWSLSEHLIIDELTSRKDVHEDHIELKRIHHGG